jgi:hypothetical protein
MGKIPAFKSIEEEAAFWGTQDTEEYADELDTVAVTFSRPLRHTVSYHGHHRSGLLAMHRRDITLYCSSDWLLMARI